MGSFVSSHYLILPSISSLVVYGLGVSVPIPKVWGMICWEEDTWEGWSWEAVAEQRSFTQVRRTALCVAL